MGERWQQMSNPEEPGWTWFSVGGTSPEATRWFECLLSWTPWFWTFGVSFDRQHPDPMDYWTHKGKRQAEGRTVLSLCFGAFAISFVFYRMFFAPEPVEETT